ncbi:hypothetical protein GN956_G6256 [Arapaima gigas]
MQNLVFVANSDKQSVVVERSIIPAAEQRRSVLLHFPFKRILGLAQRQCSCTPDQGLLAGGGASLQVLYKVLGTGEGWHLGGMRAKMWLLSDMAFRLLAMVLVNYVCVETALLRRSSAIDFLSHLQERRSARCLVAGCSTEDSETEELLEPNSDYEENLTSQLNGESKSGQSSSADSEAAMEDGSGM